MELLVSNAMELYGRPDVQLEELRRNDGASAHYLPVSLEVVETSSLNTRPNPKPIVCI